MSAERATALTPRVVLALGLVALGLLLTLGNLGLIPRDVLRYWPVLLILFGAMKLSVAQETGGRLAGGVWIFVGSWLLLQRLGVFDVSLKHLWPLGLVVLGLYLLRQGQSRPAEASGLSNAHAVVHSVAVMGGVQRSSNSADFKGGELLAVMGGCELDLRQAGIASGEATLNLFAFMGGIEIRVPPEWSVASNVVPFMGGYEDTTRPPKEGGGPRLVLRGLVVWGGVEVKN